MWNSIWWVRFFNSAPRWLLAAVNWLLSVLFLNRLVLWYGGGVPLKQYELILADGLTVPEYCGRTMSGVAHNSLLRNDNYFYYNCLMGACVLLFSGGGAGGLGPGFCWATASAAAAVQSTLVITTPLITTLGLQTTGSLCTRWA